MRIPPVMPIIPIARTHNKQPSVNVFEFYGDAFKFTAKEKAMIAILKKASEK
jgi:hypothetical protein